MSRYCARPARAVLLACLCAATATVRAAPADGGAGFFDNGHWRLAVSPWSLHFSASEEHKPVLALALEWQRHDAWLWGGSFFTNSFGQPSAYLYLGQRMGHVLDVEPRLFVQWSAGMMYGYRDPYQHKVPFNSNGFSPGLLLSLGWAFDERSSVQINLLGTAGLMLQVSHEIR